VLKMNFPKRDLDAPEQSIKEAGLLGASLFVHDLDA
jgi:hypothetical protein